MAVCLTGAGISPPFQCIQFDTRSESARTPVSRRSSISSVASSASSTSVYSTYTERFYLDDILSRRLSVDSTNSQYTPIVDEPALVLGSPIVLVTGPDAPALSSSSSSSSSSLSSFATPIQDTTIDEERLDQWRRALLRIEGRSPGGMETDDMAGIEAFFGAMGFCDY